MIVTTADVVPGSQVQMLGLVRGNVSYSKNIGRDLMAGFKNIAGGEIKSYTDLCLEARNIAEQRMIAQAEKLGANAVVAVRFDSDSVAEGCLDMLCYGTAVKLL